LADGSATQPISKLDDVPVNIGDIWVLEDFIVVNIPETDNAQVILGKAILAITGCQIEVRGGCISFEVKGKFAMFTHGKVDIVSPRSSVFDALPLSTECDMEDVLYAENPPDSEWILYKDPNQGYLKVEFSLLCHLTNPRLKPLLLMILR